MENEKSSKFKTSVTAEDLSRFFRSANVDGKCPMCGNHHWQMALTDEDHIFSHMSIDKGTQAISGPSLPVITVVCTRCWYIRSHAALPIFKWLAENQPSTEIPERTNPGE